MTNALHEISHLREAKWLRLAADDIELR